MGVFARVQTRPSMSSAYVDPNSLVTGPPVVLLTVKIFSFYHVACLRRCVGMVQSKVRTPLRLGIFSVIRKRYSALSTQSGILPGQNAFLTEPRGYCDAHRL